MTNSNKLVGALLISVWTIGSTLPSQYTDADKLICNNTFKFNLNIGHDQLIEIKDFFTDKKTLGFGLLAGLTAYAAYKYWKSDNEADEPSEATGTIQQAKDAIATSLSYVSDTAQTYPKLTAAASAGTVTLICGAHAYRNGYIPNNLDALIKSSCETVKPIVTLIKSDLTIDGLVQDSSTYNASCLNDFFKKVVKAGRIGGCLFLASACIAYVGPQPSPDAQQYETKTSWPLAVMVGPIREELWFTGVGSLLFKDSAQIVIPNLFAALHIVGPGSTLQDRNMKIRTALSTWLVNFVHQRVVRQNLQSELPVVIMSHMIHNQLALAYKDWQEKRKRDKLELRKYF